VLTTVEALAEQPFLAGLTEYQLGLLAPLSSRTMFHAGSRVFNEGDIAERFWLITDGRVFLTPKYRASTISSWKLSSPELSWAGPGCTRPTAGTSALSR